MRPYRWRLARRGEYSRGWRVISTSPWAWVLLGVVVSLGCGLLASESGEAQSYSAYSDPEKPVLSFVLSDEANVEEFRSEFGLGDEEVATALKAVREENEALAREYAQSEQLVESSEGLPEDRIRATIDSSDYDERVREIIAGTKATIEGLLPEDRRSDLESWVNAKFAEGSERAAQGTVTVLRTRVLQGARCEVPGVRHPVQRLHQVRGRSPAQEPQGQVCRQEGCSQGRHHPQEGSDHGPRSRRSGPGTYGITTGSRARNGTSLTTSGAASPRPRLPTLTTTTTARTSSAGRSSTQLAWT